MSAQTVVDPIRFAREATSRSGEFVFTELDRLRDELACEQGVVRWRLEGVLVGGRPAMRLLVEANPTLVCQRCLGPYVHSLHSEGLIFLARNETELARWESDDPLLDAIVAEEALDVRMLIEDEILLSLPVVPHHEDGVCQRIELVQGAN
jgi:uncharacterized protein